MSETKTKQALQAAFNTATIGVLKQGGPAMSNDMYNGPACAYRVDGRKCAVGQLLSDEQIAKYGIQPSDVVRNFSQALLNELLPDVPTETTRAFLGSLQSAHDNVALEYSSGLFSDRFINRVNGLAAQYGLDPINMDVQS
jgi:hypothetical protein